MAGAEQHLRCANGDALAAQDVMVLLFVSMWSQTIYWNRHHDCGAAVSVGPCTVQRLELLDGRLHSLEDV